MTNLLAMPLVNLTVSTGTNEDWIDSIKFVVEAGGAIETWPQLDLGGIVFEMEVRRQPPDNEVVIRGLMTDGSLMVGAPPDYGFITINIDHEIMERVRPGDYIGDIVGKDDVSVRRVITMDLTVVQGITRT